jgi:preprotein translocase subunit SecY
VAALLSQLTLLRLLNVWLKRAPGRRKYQYYRRYANLVDAYVLAWLLALVLLGLLAYHVEGIVRIVCSTIAVWRLLEIVSYSAHNVLGESTPQAFQSYRRTVVLAVANFIEVAAAFAVIYAAGKSRLQPPVSRPLDAMDPFYFSLITQLTVGYGDCKPTGWLRGIAMLQAVTGTLLLIAILSRFVGLIRSPGVMDESRPPR